ncbi:MAG TPA: hypothetical protein VGC69_18550 [Bordetella sp.]
MSLFDLDLIPVIGGIGIVLLLVGFNLHDYKAGPVLMPLGMAMVLGTIVLKIYIAAHR